MSQDEGRNIIAISLKILHQAWFKTVRQAATSAERHALTVASCPSLKLRLSELSDIFNLSNENDKK